MTGLTDEAGVRYGTYAYDAQGRVTRSELAGGAERLDFAYGNDASGTPTTSVTDYASGTATSRSYTFTDIGNVRYPASLTAPCSLCGSTQQASSYDANGNPIRQVAHDGSVTFYKYDTKGREIERATFPSGYAGATTRPALANATKVISTKWHATFNLPTQVAEPNKIAANTYNGKGMLTDTSWTATTDATGAAKFTATKTGSTYATGWSYSASSLATTAIEKVDAVETQRWTTAYAANGDITRVTDVTGGNKSSRSTRYDAHGNQLAGTDFDGLSVAYTYSARGRLISRTEQGATSGYAFTPTGRLNSVSTSQGVMTYTRDSLGNITRVDNDYVYRAAYPTALQQPASLRTMLSKLLDAVIPSAMAQTASCKGYGMVAHLGALHVYDTAGQLVAAYTYTSGVGGSTDYTSVNVGPIPPGRYTFDPASIGATTRLQQSLGGRVPSVPSPAGGWLWADLGSYYVKLIADPSNPVPTRSGFMIHGGRKPGSLGCIDLGNKDTDLLLWLKSNACSPVTLIVTTFPVPR